MREITTIAAAAEFAVEMLTAAMNVWPQLIASDPRLFGGETSRLAADRNAAFEFAMACISVQAQALPNVATPQLAASLEAQIRKFIRDGEGGEHALATFDKYFAAWSRQPSAGTPYTLMPLPSINVAAELYAALAIESNTRVLDQMLLGDGVTRLGIGWWKRMLEATRVVLT